MVSRYRGESASPLHQGDRNFTCTETKLSKTNRCWSMSLILDSVSHFQGTDRTLHFVPPLRVCIRAPTRGPMSLRGKHCFKNRRSYSQRTTSVLLRRREAYTRMAIFTNSDSRKEQCDDERFLLTFSSVALGPSLPRSCPAVLYNMGTSCTICNACTCIFVKLFRNC